ncbi:MAG: TIGR03067 domain-containing protein [Pirellulaceae bacterium]
MHQRLDRITTRAESESAATFNNVFTLLNTELLYHAFRRLKRDKAPGVDGMTVEDYEENLLGNLRKSLLSAWHFLKGGSLEPPSPAENYMRLLIFGIVSVLFLCVAIDARADTPRESNRHDSQLDGIWVLKSIETGGITVEGDGMPDRMQGTTRTIEGGDMILSRGGGTRQMMLAIVVDTSAKPRQMDILAKRDGKTRVLKCIYEIKNDTLRIAENAMERPVTFKTDTSNRTMVTTYLRETQAGSNAVRDAVSSDQPKSQ